MKEYQSHPYEKCVHICSKSKNKDIGQMSTYIKAIFEMSSILSPDEIGTHFLHGIEFLFKGLIAC